MATTIKTALATGCISLMLLACGGGGGGDRAPGVEPGPTEPGGPVEPPPPILPSTTIDASQLTDSDTVEASITGISLNSPPTVTFTLVANGLQTVSGLDQLDSNPLAAAIARLPFTLEEDTYNWVSQEDSSEDPVCRDAEDIADANNQCTEASSASDPAVIPDTARKVQDPAATGKTPTLQATTESSGTLADNSDGSWNYTLSTDIDDPASRSDMHRICLQFSLDAPTSNACIDFIPQDLLNTAIGDRATSLDSAFYENYDSRQIVADDTCNSCHAQLELHGGNRRDVDYCVTCHNPGSTDANSENTVDFKVMAHKIHAGLNLPSVNGNDTADPPRAPVPYKIWGFRNGEHDYSHLNYPGQLFNCTRCHAGQEDVDYAAMNDLPEPVAEITPDGHLWANYNGRPACLACHDDKENHRGGGTCSNCHDDTRANHRNAVNEARANYQGEILAITNTAPGQNTRVDFQIVDPRTDPPTPYDILNDPVWQQGSSSLSVTLAWDTADYTNDGNQGGVTGNPEANASTVSINALAGATSNGDGSFHVTSALAVPDGTITPNIRASGSGAVTIEGHPAQDLDGSGEYTSVPLNNVVGYFSIDEAGGEPSERRQSVDLDNCLACHDSLVLHGGNRSDNIDGCVTCHNPRNTDRRVRENPNNAGDPPTDGKQEESIDFKTMIHAIHAASIRENPLQVVGFMGFSTHVYDEEHVQYPGDLKNCSSCHTSDGASLPLAPGVLATTVDTGTDRSDPTDDFLTTPISAICSSCHDSEKDQAHMENDGGGRFNTPYTEANAAIETCDVCHKNGASAGVDVVHAR